MSCQHAGTGATMANKYEDIVNLQRQRHIDAAALLELRHNDFR